MANQDPDAPPASAALTQAELGDLCEVTTGELQADAARNRGVDAARRSVGVEMPRTPDGDLRSSKPAGPRKARDEQLEALRAENARVTEAVKELAVEPTLVRGNCAGPE